MRFDPEPEGKLLNLPKPILGYSLVEFTIHALSRMKQRSVTEKDVLRTLESNRQIPGPQLPGRTRVRWHKNAKMAIDVVYAKEKDRLIIISVIIPESRS